MIKIKNNISAMLALASAVSAVGAFSSNTYAQQGEIALEEVIVTARKREESLQDVAVSVTAITTQLDNSAVRNIKDLQNYVPNVSIDMTPASSAASISIRGVSFQEPDKSLDPPIGVILDGVYIGTAAGQLMDNFDIERIEVLRGPQGTLFGKNTVGGALNIVRSEPTKEFGAKVKVGADNFGLLEAKAVVNLPLTEAGGLKLFATKSESDGYIENDVYGGDVGGTDFQQFGATAAFDIGDNFDIALTLERIEDDSDWGAFSNFNEMSELACMLPALTAGMPEGCAESDPNSDEDHSSTNGPNSASATNDFAALTMNWTVADWTLTSITGAVSRDEDARLEYDANSIEFMYVNTGSEYSQFSQEFRASGELTDNIFATFGAYYWDSDYKQNQTSYQMWDWFGMPPGATQHLDNSGTNTATSLFANVDWNITEDLILNLGGRYTDEEKTITTYAAGIKMADGTPITPDGPEEKFDQSWTNFSPRVALQYNFTDDVMAFVSYSEGFRSGGYFARSTVPDADGYDPETVNSWEAGVKTELWNNRLRLNGTLFYGDYQDKQEDVIVSVPGQSANTVIRNAADAVLQGVELEATAQLTHSLSVYANAGYLDASFKDFYADIDGGAIEEPTDNSDLELRNAPEYTFAAGADYYQDVGFGELGLHYSYRWTDDYQTVIDNDPRGEVEAMGIHNASIDLTVAENYRISAYGRNLSDERYARVVVIPTFAAFGQYNAPRNFGVELVADF
ncbi:Pesticin receptor [Sinobacterium norvegicum]|uniref:Pesticin receptor n=1 Tax=Sinobacterium norvegicum TaxID=1641715 RepID=A0ABM9AIK7_9GAMM|nr:TonB-dependent receptor [Sinobacterium norvegicum]CAH0993063.1 Pesticin receptor [Sinobacterium norvegicum]